METSYKDTFSGDFRRGVYCADCCGGIYPYYNTEAEAIAAWNSRADYLDERCYQTRAEAEKRAERIKLKADPDLPRITFITSMELMGTDKGVGE